MATATIAKTIQQRSFNHKPTIEKRADGQSVITGYAAVFFDGADTKGTEYDLGWDMVERIMPSAFNRAISEKHDVRGLVNHDPNWLLGRTAAGTMTLAVDSKGLRYEIPINPNDPDHLRAHEKLARGDMTGSSFGFMVREEVWREVDDIVYREIVDLDLYDVGPVTFPAYTGTEAGLRSKGDADQAKAALEEWRAKNKPNTALVDLRMNQIKIDSDSLSLGK